MSEALLRTDKEITDIYMRHVKTVYRVCFAYMKNKSDTEDAVEETFYRMIRKGPQFENEEHEKAWLIRTATNICLNMLNHWQRNNENIDDHTDLKSPEKANSDEILQAVLKLPEKYKTVVYLYYYEGYTSPEIAEILQKPNSTVRNHLHEARTILKERLGDDFYEK